MSALSSPPEKALQAGPMSKLSTIVVDLAPHPFPAWAIIWKGQLLPIRFSREGEAEAHLAGLEEARNHPDGDRRSA